MGLMKQISIEIERSEALKFLNHRIQKLEEFRDEVKKILGVLDTRIQLLEELHGK